MFDRFAVCNAYYWYGVTHHSGQNSPEYKYFGRLQKLGYKPAQSVEAGKLDHAAAEIYTRLVRQNESRGYNTCACRDCMEVTLAVFCPMCEECGINQECMSNVSESEEV